MDKANIRRMGMGLLIAAAVLAGILTALAVADKRAEPALPRADIIIIDGLKTFGPLERPAVPFYHDKHTQALAQQQKDCLACHPSTDNRLSLKFKRTEDVSKPAVMAIYHDECIACHKEMREPGKSTGPVTCGECHVEKRAGQSNWQAIGLDKALHYRHTKAMDNKCEQCHHEYNPETQKLFYAKGQEGACIYCHKEQTEENRISNRLASHQSCIDCHRERTAQNKSAGPQECAGCHDPKQQALIERPAEVPRMDRNQPDAVLVKAVTEEQAALRGEVEKTIAGVPFDHKAHEGYNDSCKVCHHASLQSCASCHSLQGNADGKMVKLAQAMHQKSADMSCVGCHDQQKEQPQCAGCHHSIPPSRSLTSEASCRTCHSAEQVENPVELTEAQRRELAAELLAVRQPVRGTVAADQIPETVIIKKLVDQYEPASMPHRKIVLKLAEANQNSKLAAYYHKDPLTLCQGCHHNSPATLKPPQCGSCHGRSSEALNLTRPGLLAAYHQQCIECHTEMGIEKPAARDCTACHAKRN
jgi:hypothetical protein